MKIIMTREEFDKYIIIKDLEKKEDTRWTLPWMFKLNLLGDLFINKIAPLESRNGGTLCVKVINTKDEKIIVDFSDVYDFDFKDFLVHNIERSIDINDYLKIDNIIDPKNSLKLNIIKSMINAKGTDCGLIKSMKNGESGFVVSWAILYNLFKGFSINGNHNIHEKKGGTADTFIKKENNRYYVKYGGFLLKAQLD